MRGLRVWAATAALFSVFALQARAQVFNPVTKTLGNGLQVVVVENHRAPIVSHMVWYRVGAADETPGKSGIAHFLEHLMFKGTPEVASGEFSKIVARNGGRDNAFTSSDYTAYFQNIAADRLELVMKMEADRMRNLTLAEADVTSELEVVKEERRSRTDNDPGALLHERLEAALYLNHPYRRPIIGWPDELAGLTRDDAMAYYKRWYAPNNAILVVAGDVDPAKVMDLAERYYGPLKPEDIPPRLRAEEPPQVGARQLTLRDSRVKQPSWSRLYLAPSAHSATDKTEVSALEVLSEVLSGGATSRLYKSLVVEKGLAAAAGASYDSGALDATTFAFYATPRPGVAMDKLQAAIEAEIARVRKDGITPDELRRAKSHLKAEVVYARDSLHTAARVLGEALTTGQSVADVEDWPNRINAVTVEQVNAAARAVLNDDASATGLLLPAAQEVRQ
ncbi:pitrilysin family protein [Magnetospirillum sp. 64-120]|uniref:M16 family metallopeptidase n=1 Tax=Magnetospirillum sp. 64-120 TaxID=1895778 RepID=UPI00092CC79A|nr:pitrilysin family protein [Magnetospirillum sp. 64-120]OJX68638.1 MAG: peptidase M16 [Magnetospirillum sp. 64-120]